MSLVIPPGFSLVAMQYSLSGDPEVMVTTCGVDNGTLGGDAPSLAELCADAWANAWGAAGSMGQGWTFIGVEVRAGQDGGPPVVAEAQRNVAGSDPTGHLPQNNALLVRKQTTLGGRQGRGRMFLPSAHLREDTVNDAGVITTTFQGNATALTNSWADELRAGGLEPVLLHDAGSPGALAPTPIVSFVCDRMIATQRERLRR